MWVVPGSARRVPADWPGGVRHVGDVSLVCCSRTKRGKARPDTAACPMAGGERECPKRAEPARGVSTVAGRAGGPARSSGEAPAWRGGGGAKGPGCPWLGSSGQPGGSGGVRVRSEEQPVSDLEPAVLGELLPTPGEGGGNTEVAWRWGPNVRGADGARIVRSLPIRGKVRSSWLSLICSTR